MEAKCPECGWEGSWKETIGGDTLCPNCSTTCVEIDRKKLSKKILLEWFQLFDNFEDICDLNVAEDCCPDCDCLDCPFFNYENWTEFKEMMKQED